MKEVKWEIERHSPTPYPKIDGWSEIVTETAGFIPLEVRFKQMEQAGIRAKFSEAEFSSQDVRDMFLNHPEFDLTPEDDIEEAMEKIALREEWINQVKAEARKRAAEEEKGFDAPPPSKNSKAEEPAEEEE